MKSLEIINSKIKQIKKDLYKLGETEEGAAKDFDKYYLTEELKDYKNVKQDLEVLEIFKKHIELEKEDSDPYDECAFYEDVLYMNINLEQDISSDEYKIIKQWLEEQE